MAQGGILLNNGAGGNTLATDRIAGLDYQEIKIMYGVAGAAPVDVTLNNGLPIQGSVVVSALQGNVLINPTSVIAGITGTVTVAGAVSSKMFDGAGNPLTSNLVGSETALVVQLVDNNGVPIVSFGGTGGTSLVDAVLFRRTITQMNPMGGRAEAAPPSLVDGNATVASFDLAGNLRVAVGDGGAQAGTAGTASVDVLSVQGTAGMVPVMTSPSPSPTPGSTRTKIFAAATNNATLLKNSAGVLLSYALFNTTATVLFVHFYDKNSTPAPGTDVQAFPLMVPPNAGLNCDFSTGIPFSNGIGMSITQFVADADNTAVAAGSIVGVLVTK